MTQRITSQMKMSIPSLVTRITRTLLKAYAGFPGV